MTENVLAISVIMPVYNAREYVGRAISSVLSQDFDSFELIIIDDGSTDGSGAICEDFAQRDNRIVLIHQKNVGTCAARNVGLSIARGKYVTFCDHDDEYLPHLLRDNFELIEREEADVLQFSVNRIYTELGNRVAEQRLTNEVILAKDLPQQYANIRLNDNFIDVWNHFYKSDVINGLSFNPIFNHGMEDVCFNLAVMPRMQQKYVLNSGVYYNHYLYSNSSGAVSKLKATEDVVEQFKILFNQERDCLKNFFVPKDMKENRGAEILKLDLTLLNNRVCFTSKQDYEKFGRLSLLADFPYRLKTSLRLYLWTFKNIPWMFRIMTRLGLGCESDSFAQSALYGFFKNLYDSKRGRWLFDICNAMIKLITLPFRMLK